MVYNKKDVGCGCGMIFALTGILILIVIAVSGPIGIQNQFNAWRASAYGSDWLVVQYTGWGDVQNHWELKNAAIHSEGHSDGIYFTTDHGVVHLSGHYLYIQNPSTEAKEKYLQCKHENRPTRKNQ